MLRGSALYSLACPGTRHPAATRETRSARITAQRSGRTIRRQDEDGAGWQQGGPGVLVDSPRKTGLYDQVQCDDKGEKCTMVTMLG